MTWSGTVTADRNGVIVGSLILSPDRGLARLHQPARADPSCVGVSYSDVSVTDTTSGVMHALPGTLSFTNPNAPCLR